MTDILIGRKINRDFVEQSTDGIIRRDKIAYSFWQIWRKNIFLQARGKYEKSRGKYER